MMLTKVIDVFFCTHYWHTSCFKYNLRTARWTNDMPEVPIGKLYPTLVSIENRFIYQIGGFDDYDYEIYCLDTYNETVENKWIEIKLRDEIAILKTVTYEESSSSSGQANKEPK